MLNRSTFGYLERTEKNEDFNCRSCKMYIADKYVCSLHGTKVKIKPSMSCILYSKGGPAPENELDHVSAAFTPEESGLYDGPVTCKNCEYYNPKESECMVFCVLGIEDEVKPDACCNAFSPKDEDEKAEHAKKPSAVLSKIKMPNASK